MVVAATIYNISKYIRFSDFCNVSLKIKPNQRIKNPFEKVQRETKCLKDMGKEISNLMCTSWPPESRCLCNTLNK